mmetsp:Transcript_32990/g.50494  ORF Transcript_32990/g.50494 Transcript_32990/m.50494 type:complete len:107 (+) Transcript_32990:689-1009(+)
MHQIVDSSQQSRSATPDKSPIQQFLNHKVPKIDPSHLKHSSTDLIGNNRFKKVTFEKTYKTHSLLKEASPNDKSPEGTPNRMQKPSSILTRRQSGLKFGEGSTKFS